MVYNPCEECSRLSPFCYRNCDVVQQHDEKSAFEAVYGDEEEFYDYKWYPTLSRVAYRDHPETICDFCANDISCRNCMFGV